MNNHCKDYMTRFYDDISFIDQYESLGKMIGNEGKSLASSKSEEKKRVVETRQKRINTFDLLPGDRILDFFLS